MKKFIVYNDEGKILRAGNCQDADFKRQAHSGEFVMKGEADAATQKIVAGEIVDKTPEEIEATDPTVNPAPVPFEKQIAYITNKQWQDVLDRLAALEAEPL